MERILRHARAGLYFMPIGLRGAVTLVTLPAVIHVAGLQTWTALAVGQSVGGFGLMLFALGWSVSGAAQVGAAAPGSAPDLLTLSVVSKAIAFIPASLILLAVLWLLSGGHPPLLSLAAAIGTATSGLSAGWYFVGKGQPLKLLILDTLPTIGMMAMGVVMVLRGADPLVVPLTQLLGNVLGLLLSWVATLRVGLLTSLRRVTRFELWRVYRRQWKEMAIILCIAAFANAPLPVLSVAAPGIAVVFAVLDRFQKQALSAALPLGTIATARLAQEIRAGNLHSAVLRGARAVAIQGLATAAGTAVLAMFLVPVLSVGKVTLTVPEALLTGALIGLALTSNTLPAVVLAPRNWTGRGLLRAMAGGALSIILAVVGATWGLFGVLLGLAVGQTVGVLSQYALLRGSGGSEPEAVTRSNA